MNPNDKNRNLDQDPASRAADRTGRNRNNAKNPDSKTFNEDEKSYDRKSGEKKNASTTNKSFSFTDNYTEEERWGADYINSDRSDYNRNDSRFYWDSYEF